MLLETEYAMSDEPDVPLAAKLVTFDDFCDMDQVNLALG